MIAEQYRSMLGQKSVIRQLSEAAGRRAQQIGAENVFDYSLGNPSVPAPEAFRRALLSLVEEEDPMRLHGYSPTLGIPSVKKAIADSLNRRFDMEYGPEHIFPVSAAAAAIAHALRAVTCPGDEVLTFAPFFPEYHPYVELTGAKLRVVPADTTSFQIDFDAFEKMLGPKVAAVLVNTPNNPSGAVYSAATLARLAELMEKKAAEYGHDIFLISDEPYREIVFDGQTQPYVSKFYRNTISCYSFSKALSIPGERIGYLAVNPACPEAAEIVNMCGQISRGIGHNCPSSLMQLAVARVLDQTADFSVYEKNRNLLYDCLTDCGFEVVKPQGTFYIFPKALEEDAAAFCRKALDYDLVLVPADSFGCPGYFRMAYCVGTEKVERSLPVLRRFVRETYGRQV
ncbi:MAG: pyridoxal phosphate-dependent aminotransferase [Eubacteriales bacterium]|nr:pyridoxal phosphate-dependent aminotransferase [Eubacteriales bacterium]